MTDLSIWFGYVLGVVVVAIIVVLAVCELWRRC